MVLANDAYLSAISWCCVTELVPDWCSERAKKWVRFCSGCNKKLVL